MATPPKYPAHEEDKYKKQQGREAAAQGTETEFLDGDGLEDDLTDPEAEGFDDSDVTDEENQEWNVREEQHRI